MAKSRGILPALGMFLMVALLSAWPIVRFQDKLDDLRSQQTADESLRYMPSGRFLSTAVLGFDNITADLLWIRGIAMFGDRYRQTGDLEWYDWLFQLIDVATELDPLDVRIYKYGALMLRLDTNRIDQSTYIFNKGMEHIPEEYFLPFGIAMNYLEVKEDPPRAAEYMRRASTCPNAPFYLRNLAATLMDQSRQQDAALAFLEEEKRALTPGSLPYKAVEVKILQVEHDQGARRLQRAMKEFLSIYNRAPTTLEEMQGRTWSGPWPVDPYGGRFVLDPDSGQIRSSEYTRARERIRKEVGLGTVRDKNFAGPKRVQ